MHAIDTHTDGAYAVLTLAGACPQAGPTLAIDYRLFFDVDPQHRGLLNFVERRAKPQRDLQPPIAQQRTVGGDATGALAAVRDVRRTKASGTSGSASTTSCSCCRCCCRRCSCATAAHGGRSDRSAARSSTSSKVVTAFTVAHSITLSLAALGVVVAAVALGRVGDRAVGRAGRAQQPVSGGRAADAGSPRSASA